MKQVQPVYVMISRTGTAMGGLIRIFTRYGYNHVSVSMDGSFQEWFSFARYVRNVPLAGGYIRETARRLCAVEGPVPVKIYRVELPQEHSSHLAFLFAQAGQSGLIYNTFSAMMTPLGRGITIPGAYTCLGFACAVLGHKCATIRELDRVLSGKLVFQGDLKELIRAEMQEDPYFAERTFWGCTWDTVGHFGRLLHRWARGTGLNDPVAQYTAAVASSDQPFCSG